MCTLDEKKSEAVEIKISTAAAVVSSQVAPKAARPLRRGEVGTYLILCYPRSVANIF